MSDTLHIAWERWQIIGQAFGDFQGRLFAMLFYFTILVPFGLGLRLFGDPLSIRKPAQQWINRPPVGTSLDEARRQF